MTLPSLHLMRIRSEGDCRDNKQNLSGWIARARIVRRTSYSPQSTTKRSCSFIFLVDTVLNNSDPDVTYYVFEQRHIYTRARLLQVWIFFDGETDRPLRQVKTDSHENGRKNCWDSSFIDNLLWIPRKDKRVHDQLEASVSFCSSLFQIRMGLDSDG